MEKKKIYSQAISVKSCKVTSQNEPLQRPDDKFRKCVLKFSVVIKT